MEQFQNLKQQLQETVRQRMDMSSELSDAQIGEIIDSVIMEKSRGSIYECGYEADTAAGIVQCDPETGSFAGAD